MSRLHDGHGAFPAARHYDSHRRHGDDDDYAASPRTWDRRHSDERRTTRADDYEPHDADHDRDRRSRSRDGRRHAERGHSSGSRHASRGLKPSRSPQPRARAVTPSSAASAFPMYNPPPGRPPLPAGFVPEFDPQYRRWYYFNMATGRSQWEAPGFEQFSRAAASPPAPYVSPWRPSSRHSHSSGGHRHHRHHSSSGAGNLLLGAAGGIAAGTIMARAFEPDEQSTSGRSSSHERSSSSSSSSDEDYEQEDDEQEEYDDYNEDGNEEELAFDDEYDDD